MRGNRPTSVWPNISLASDPHHSILPAPMLLDDQPFDHPGWIYELKFDGYRLVAGVQDGEVQLATRNSADVIRWFQRLCRVWARIPPGGPHILDGEVCVLDDLGRSGWVVRIGLDVAVGTRHGPAICYQMKTGKWLLPPWPCVRIGAWASSRS